MRVRLGGAALAWLPALAEAADCALAELLLLGPAVAGRCLLAVAPRCCLPEVAAPASGGGGLRMVLDPPSASVGNVGYSPLDGSRPPMNHALICKLRGSVR